MMTVTVNEGGTAGNVHIIAIRRTAYGRVNPLCQTKLLAVHESRRVDQVRERPDEILRPTVNSQAGTRIARIGQ